MDKPTTGWWLTRYVNCADIAAEFDIETEVVVKCFLGEPIKRTLAIVQEALKERAAYGMSTEPYDPAFHFQAWAAKNRAGYYRPVEKRNGLQQVVFGAEVEGSIMDRR